MREAAKDTGAIARSAGTVSVAVMCSRVLGLVREQVFATLFGAGFAYDSFVVAFRIPNLLRDLFGEGALSAAFVTVFTDHDTKRGPEATWRLANNVLCFFAVVVSLLVLAGMVFSGSLVSLLAPEFATVAGKAELTRKLTVIMFPFLVFISLSAVVMGILNAKRFFFVPAMASSFFNLGSIVGGVGLAFLLPKISGQPAIVGMAIGTLIGGMLQLCWQLPALFRTGFALFPRIDLADPGLRRILRLMVPAVIGLSATQINVFVNTYFASSCAEGSVSWLNYAFRLVQFPIGVFGVAVSIATLPVISRYASLKNLDALRETYGSSLIMAFCLTVPSTVGLWLLAEPIIRIIFEHGAFTAADTVFTAEALAFYSVGLFAYSAVKITVPVFYALDDTRLPVVASFLAVAANVAIILLTIGPLQHRAIALSTSAAMIASFIFLLTALRYRLGGLPIRHLLSGLCRIILVAGVMGGWLLFCVRIVQPYFSVGLVGQVFFLVLAIVSAGLLYGGGLFLLRVKESAFIFDKLAARFGRGSNGAGPVA